MNQREKTENILMDIADEFNQAVKFYPKFNSFHEGYAVIKEEFDELWEEIRVYKANNPYDQNLKEIREEAIQTAAMVVRFIYDLLEE